MGAEQSSTSSTEEGSLQICYYELLGIDRNAQEHEIKKAYRSKALELHPDRNHDDIENATRRFAEVQTAYEVLSDPQQRAWYEVHRGQIIGGHGKSGEDLVKPIFEFSSASQITTLFHKFSCNIPFSDEPTGFYGSLRNLFATIASEEGAACRWANLDILEYPGFGRSSDEYKDVVKLFYRIWQNFSTRKTFSWKDIYTPSKAPDRVIRRLMNKENQKLRDEAIKGYNDAIRHLVASVRKRDPRYLPNFQTESDRQSGIRDAATAQANRSRAANKAKLVNQPLPAWIERSNSQVESESTESEESEESEVEYIECVACQKIFKSENQFQAHERSKKHLKSIQQFRKNTSEHNDDPDQGPVDNSRIVPRSMQLNFDPPTNAQIQLEPENLELQHSSQPGMLNSSNILDEIELRTNVTSGLNDDLPKFDDGHDSSPEIESQPTAATLGSLRLQDSTRKGSGACDAASSESEQKLGKAKAKRAKKAARKGAVSHAAHSFECASCKYAFSSRTKLFSHLNEMKHARPSQTFVEAKRHVKS